eukprot:353437-Chlamydomonas_euryale.AAC.6
MDRPPMLLARSGRSVAGAGLQDNASGSSGRQRRPQRAGGRPRGSAHAAARRAAADVGERAFGGPCAADQAAVAIRGRAAGKGA